MKQAEWNGVVVAASDDIVVVEGNAYFPPESLRQEHFSPSETHTVCPWKGTASYLHVTANGKTVQDAAWFYPSPHAAAAQVAGRVAFWRGVVVRDV